MNFGDLKEGVYIKWKADRQFKAWDTFGIVSSIKGDEAIIMTYDDFKETAISKNGDAIEGEITLCNKNDISDYLQVRVAKLNTKKVEIEIQFKKETRSIDSIIEKTSEHINKLKN